LDHSDVLVVWKLDRLARSLKKLITTAEDLEERGIGLVSLTENIDTTTPGGVLVFHVFGAIAQFERALIRERTTAGLAEARRRGRKGGRVLDRNLNSFNRPVMIRRLLGQGGGHGQALRSLPIHGT
jgi:DNA invertase Pin-like site-specific DNA recombinase